MIDVFIVDDHDIVRQGMVSILQSVPGCHLVGQAASGVEALKMITRLKPHVVITDLSMPDMNGLELISQVKSKLPQCRLLVLTMHDEEEYVHSVVQAGAMGFLLKDKASDELVDALDALAKGHSYFGQHAQAVINNPIKSPLVSAADPLAGLTNRERQVFHLIIEGKSTKQVAELLSISTKTVENHRGKVLDKFNVANTVELVRLAAKHHLIT